MSPSEEDLLRCCGSKTWVDRVQVHLKDEGLEGAIRSAFDELKEEDWLDAFAAHPRIGEKSLRDRWATGEQSGVKDASEDLIAELTELNRLYFEKFGFIFIICATGKSAKEMRDQLKHRLPRSRAEEISTAAGEQVKITELRLKKLMEEDQ